MTTSSSSSSITEVLSHPIFTSTVISGVIPYFISVAWLYRRYTHSMTPREKEIIWAGLAHEGDTRDPVPTSKCLPKVSYLRIWTATASLSAVAFMTSWIAMLTAIKEPSQTSYSDYVFCVIILIQSVYNVLMVLLVSSSNPKLNGKIKAWPTGSRYYSDVNGSWFLTHMLLASKLVLVAIILWAAALSYVWLWYICWERFNLASSSSLKWVLHFLNLCLVFHGVWWDAIFWWCTWCREMIRERQSRQLMQWAEYETKDVFSPNSNIQSMADTVKREAEETRHSKSNAENKYMIANLTPTDRDNNMMIDRQRFNVEMKTNSIYNPAMPLQSNISQTHYHCQNILPSLLLAPPTQTFIESLRFYPYVPLAYYYHHS